jgi:ribose-phosphate pyrophosphokinase
MSVLLVSTVPSQPFARRVADGLGVPLATVERQHFPDGEDYLRFDVGERLGLLGKDVVIVAATECDRSTDEAYRLGYAAVKDGARTLVLVIPYFGYSTMERAVQPGEVVTAKAIARRLSAIPRAPHGNWVLLMDLHAAGIVHYFEGDAVALELYAQPKLLPVIQRLGLSQLCLASTDMGPGQVGRGVRQPAARSRRADPQETLERLRDAHQRRGRRGGRQKRGDLR